MFFTRVGNIVAWIALVVGVLRLATGVYVLLNLGNKDFDSSRYLAERPGEAIDQGVIVILFALALGTVTEISRAVRR